ncbi:MAG: cytochrome c biogenesis protein CcsA [Pirellulales bacterium]|nr:cytochrome c biogenesis protein CcsA [Pirellulales bacterium]
MATDLLPTDFDKATSPGLPRRSKQPKTFRSKLERTLRPLASLKLTVALFGLSIFLIFAGTLAQSRYDVWWVMSHYFRSLFVWIDFQVFLPPAWFPHWQDVGGGIWFPGGFLIGGLMVLNLLAAHGLRFKFQARGLRLWSGLAVIGLGCLLTWFIVAAGPDKDGLQATMPFRWKTMWQVFLMGLAISCVGIAGALFFINQSRKAERLILTGVGALLLAVLAALLLIVDTSNIDSDSMLSSMRILWQVIEGAFAAAVLLAGCLLVFRKRAGIVLLHAGVLLLMLNELLVYSLHKETMLYVSEGQSTNYGTDLRSFELAIINRGYSEAEQDVVVVPEQLLRDSAATGHRISRPGGLPVDIQVKSLADNGAVRNAKPEDEIEVTAGSNKGAVLVPLRTVTGADGGEQNMPAAYVEFFEHSSGHSLGTYLLNTTQLALVGLGSDEQSVGIGDKTYQVVLRFERDYKPYSIHLYDVERENYPGTQVPKSYSSEFQLVDAKAGVDRRAKIRMNEPLRYGGETFYQSSNPIPVLTGISVVSNFGWMIPYLACMIVATGMLAQFSLVLTRFVRRREAPVVPGAATLLGPAIHPASKFGRWLPWMAASLAAAVLLSAAIPRSAPLEQMDFDAFGRIRINTGGRIQPIDSLARNTLRMISSREVYVDASDNHPSALKRIMGLDEYQPATRWFLDAIARPEVAQQHRVFRIENPDVLATFGLDRRKYFRYSLAELQQQGEKFDDEVKRVREVRDEAKHTIFDKKLMELRSRLDLYLFQNEAFNHLPLPSLDVLKKDPANLKSRLETIKKVLAAIPRLEAEMAESSPPCAIPRLDESDAGNGLDLNTPIKWEPYSIAWLKAYQPRIKNELMPNEPPAPINPALVAWDSILDAYRSQDAARFNQAVHDYARLTDKLSPAQLNHAHPGFEFWFNTWGPFLKCQWLYFAAFCFAALAWLGWSRTLNRTAFWLIAVTFLAHTFALCARMHISGRPPVTNLYSASIFIGWAGVLAGLVLERVYRLGFGNILAAVAGFASLIIADRLSLVYDMTRGDTVGVMQAVLDTQFWLATHVTCITLGNSTTFIAGILGLIYVIRGVFTRSLSAEESKSLARMIYGTVCFGIFFSFVGTVLGGLWADDSWGRFWGWDPKENGALIIVLWNALILHARWDGLVKDRGMAVLAIGGNIITGWSLFGVNQLGVGLHSYGFTEGVLVALGIFCLSQLAMIGIGLLPLRFWASFRRATAVA